MKKCLCSFVIFSMLTARRNIHHYQKNGLSHIEVWSNKNNRKYHLIDNNLRPVPLLHVFNEKHFEENLLPTQSITYDNGQKMIAPQKINQLIEFLFTEINKKNKEYRDFTILKKSGFVRHKKCGLLILKFKNYPFILKLFMEPPKSFVNPYDKGFEVTNFFIAGGALRHTLGFTRIETLNYVQKAIQKSDKWRSRISLPRKWFWLPKDPVWLHIKTYNLGQKKEDSIAMPSIYGVIADELQKDPDKETDYNELMEFSQFLEHRIDPHTKNFFIEKKTGKIALIDTELFPLILGFNEKIDPQNTHIEWYTHLASKYIKEKMGTLKNLRIKRQHDIKHYYLQ